MDVTTMHGIQKKKKKHYSALDFEFEHGKNTGKH